MIYGPDDITPIEQVEHNGAPLWLKRDDLVEIDGVQGGAKLRTAWAMAQGSKGLVTCGARHSPQLAHVALVARALGLPMRGHTAAGESTPELARAASYGAEIVSHRPGYNNVIASRAEADARERGWKLIPFGMEHYEAVEQTARQVQCISAEVERIVIAVGSGMSTAGLLHGLKRQGYTVPVLGEVVGASPLMRLARYAPTDWHERLTLHTSPLAYSRHLERTVGSVVLDPVYEAKCYNSLQPYDLLWIVGCRPL